MKLNVFIGILIPFVGTTLGAAAVFMMRKNISDKMQSILSGFAAGVMIAASIWSLLIPCIDASSMLGRLSFIPALIGFWLGILFLLLLDHVIPHLHWVTNDSEGINSHLTKTAMLVLAVTIHNIPEGISVALPIYHLTGKKRYAMLYAALSGITEPIGALVGMFVFGLFIPNFFVGFLMATVAGIMTYISFDTLLPLAKEYGSWHLSIIGIISGIIFIWFSLILLG